MTHPIPRAGRRSGTVLAGLAAASALLLGACGSSLSSSTSETAATDPSSSAATLTKDPVLHDALPEAIKTAGVLKVGIDPTYAPMEFTDDSNNIVGSDPELITAMGQVLGVKIEYVKSSFAALIPSLNAGRFDVAMNMGDYFKREANADFVDFFLSKRAFLVPSDASDLSLPTDLCGMRVGLLQGTDAQDKVDEINPSCEEEGKSTITASAFPTNNDAILALGNGRVDAVFADTPTLGWAAKQSDGKFRTTGTEMFDKPPYYGMLTPKGSPLVQPLAGALDKVIESGLYAEIFTRWGLQDGLIDKAVINGAKE